jgi:tetratricopeptide (TPR) repeat protein
LVWLKGALQFDQGHPRTSARLGLAYYFLGRYDEAVEALDRALARNSGRNTQILTHAVLAAVYAEMGRDQDAENERVVVTHLSPLLSGQKVNSFNWLQSSASSNRSGVAKIADWIGIFSNTVTERTCSNV